MQQIKQALKFARSTKGTHFFEAADQTTAHIKTVYVQKEAFLGNPPPQNITVTIDETKTK